MSKRRQRKPRRRNKKAKGKAWRRHGAERHYKILPLPQPTEEDLAEGKYAVSSQATDEAISRGAAQTGEDINLCSGAHGLLQCFFTRTPATLSECVEVLKLSVEDTLAILETLIRSGLIEERLDGFLVRRKPNSLTTDSNT